MLYWDTQTHVEMDEMDVDNRKDPFCGLIENR